MLKFLNPFLYVIINCYVFLIRLMFCIDFVASLLLILLIIQRHADIWFKRKYFIQKIPIVTIISLFWFACIININCLWKVFFIQCSILYFIQKINFLIIIWDFFLQYVMEVVIFIFIKNGYRKYYNIIKSHCFF